MSTVISQKTELFRTTAVRTSNPARDGTVLDLAAETDQELT
jgi:hypothetical protein